MASNLEAKTNGISPNSFDIEIPIHANKESVENESNINYFQRAQWLRAAMLGANDGLITVASMMIGIGAIKEDISVMILTGFAGLVAGACSMAIGEFVSVYTQYDIEIAQMKREREANNNNNNNNTNGVVDEESTEREKLPNPFQAALASALAFSVGAVMPLLAASFIRNHKMRMGVVGAVVSMALLVFGGVGALVGKTPVMKSCVRVLIGGWMAMAITFGFTKLIGRTGI